MDDYWLFSDSLHELQQVSFDVEEGLSQIGLALNSAKTKIAEAKDVLSDPEGFGGINASGVMSEAAKVPDVRRVLDTLVGELVKGAEDASRARIGFVINQLRWNDRCDDIRKIEPVKDELGHAADLVARCIADTGRWRENEKWYVDYAGSRIGSADWTVPAWGSMFLEDTSGATGALEVFLNKVAEARQTVVLPLAAHRAVRWARDDAAGALEDAALQVAGPFQSRAIALAMADGGLGRGTVRRVVEMFRGAQGIRALMEQHGYKRIRTRKANVKKGKGRRRTSARRRKQ